MKPARTDLTPAKTPRGFADRGAAELAATREMADAIRKTYELWGFEGVETPFLEYTEALGKFLPDQDRPNAGVFSLKDDDDQWLSLRYDLTAPLARHVAENFQKIAKPYRSYRFGPVFRNEKPGPGRFRQFLQFDADIVGAPSVAADAEMCMMMADTLDALGLRGKYVVKVNNRKILDGVMEAIGLGGDDNAGRRLTVLRAIDKLDRLGPEGVRALLGAGRKDESGDFTKGAGLDDGQIATVSAMLGYQANADEISVAIATDDPHAPSFQKISRDQVSGRPVSDAGRKHVEELGFENANGLGFIQAVYKAARSHVSATINSYEGYDELVLVAQILRKAGYSDRVRIDPSVVRGLEYYTGPVYEAELTFKIDDEHGKPIQFGSVGGGGRYDGLVGRFMAENTPATGFSIGVSRLLAALQALKGDAAETTRGPVVVLVLDKDRIGDSMALAARLRGAGIAAEVYLGASGMKAQMKYADRRKSPCVVIQGSDEREKGEVTLKDLVEGAKAAAGISDRAEWTEARPAQVTVAEDRLVDEVRAILERHA